MTIRPIHARASDELSCAELVDERIASPIGKPWSDYVRILRESIEAKRSSIIVLHGSFGSGKTLFIRASIAEYAFIEPYIAPIYIKLRSVFRGKTINSLRDVFKNALRHTLEHECLNEMVKEALKYVEQYVDQELRGDLMFLDAVKTLANKVWNRYGLHLVVFIDEFEALPHYSEDEIVKAFKLSSMFKNIFDNLYTLASKNRGYLIVLGTVYRLIDLVHVFREVEKFTGSTHKEFLS